MKDRIVLLVEEFFKHLEKREPFERELMEFKLRLRAKLLETTVHFSSEAYAVNRNLNYILEALEEKLEEEINNINYDSEIHLTKAIKTFEVLNEVLKEFMYENLIQDKRRLSSVAGFTGKTVETLKGEYRKRFGGVLNDLRKKLGLS